MPKYRCLCGKIYVRRINLMNHVRVCGHTSQIAALEKSDMEQYSAAISELEDRFERAPARKSMPIEKVAPTLAGMMTRDDDEVEMITIPLSLFKALMESTTIDFSILTR